MPGINIIRESKISNSSRVKQLSAMFDVPIKEVSRLEWHGDFPFNAEPWNVGLIVGPSGCGKSTIAREIFGEERSFKWDASHSVIDDFDPVVSMADLSAACQSVGFNTIPAWMRPHAVLSTGEKFRVELARRIAEQDGIIMVDEFTSVIDRQVAQIGSHAVQKWARKHNRQFVGVTCHYDLTDWLQPDWTFEPATMTFTRRSLQRRPTIEVEVARVPYSYWSLFAPFHYLTNELHRSARCFCLFIGGQPVAFAGMLHRPHPKVRDIKGCSRLVTLPDWQGLGLAMILIEFIGSAYKAQGYRTHTYPAHPALMRSFDHSPHWAMEQKPGAGLGTKHIGHALKPGDSTAAFGGRPNAVFSYQGPAMLNEFEAWRVTQ